MLTESEARRPPVSDNWSKAMEEFKERRQSLIDSRRFFYVYTNGYVALKNGSVVWHSLV